MKSGNLIPADRIAARQLRFHARGCAAFCGAFAFAALLVAMSCRLSWDDNLDAMRHNLEMTNDQAQIATVTAERYRAESSAAKNELDTSRRIRSQPDWGLLVGAIAQRADDSIVLKSIAVSMANAPAMSIPFPLPAPMGKIETAPRRIVSITGVGDSRLSVSRYILALDKSGLFSRVNELESKKESLLGTDGVSFKLECMIDEGKK